MKKPKKKDYPPLPKNSVFLGKGNEFKRAHSGDFLGWGSYKGRNEWSFGLWEGTDAEYYYAAPAESEIAKLNGLSPKPKTKPKRKSVAWLPTSRSPWAVIYFDQARKEWRFLGFRETRTGARALARLVVSGHYGQQWDQKTAPKVRVVRAMIPLR